MVILQSYTNAAARTDASLIRFPPVILTHQATSGSDAAQQTGASSIPDPDPGSTKKRKKSVSHWGSEFSEASPIKQCKVEGASTAAAVSSAALLDDDIDWTATADNTDLHSADHAVAQANESQLGADEPDFALAHANAAGAHTCLEPQQAPAAAQEAPCSTRDKGDKQVQHAVGEYVKALLDPFYKAGIVNREVSSHTKPALHVLHWCRTAYTFNMSCLHTKSQLHSNQSSKDTCGPSKATARHPALAMRMSAQMLYLFSMNANVVTVPSSEAWCSVIGRCTS